MLAREDFASELFGSQHRVTGITGDLPVGYSPYKAAHRIFVHPPTSFHLHSPWQRAGVLLVVSLPHSAIRNLSRGSDRLRCPSRPKQHWDFDPAEKELTPLPVPGYGFGYRKRWFKNPIRATIALTVEGALLARSYCPVVGIVLDH
jgi:hypothetical protein